MKNQKMSLLTKNMLTNSLGTVLLKSIPLITTPIISILLTPMEYGKVSLFLTWIALIGVFVGLQMSGSLQNALVKYGEENYNKYCSSILSLAFLSFIAIFIPFLILSEQLSKLFNLDKVVVILMVPTCFGSFCVSFFSSYFLSLKKAKKNLFLTLSITLIIAITSLLGAKFFTNKYLGYIYGYTLSYIIIGTGLFIIYTLKYRCFYSKEFWKFSLLFSLPLIFHMLSNTLLSQCDKLMIEYINGDTSGVGVYNMMHTVASLVSSLWSAMNSAFVPFYYDYLKNDDKEELFKRSQNYSFIFTCITAGFMLVSPELTSLLIDEQYLVGINLLPLMILSFYFSFLYSFSVNYEFYNGKTIWVAIGTLLTSIVNVILNFFFLKLYGVFGAALATTISYFLLFLFHEIISRKVIKNYPISIKFLAVSCCIILIFFAVTYIFFVYSIVRWIIFLVVVFMFFYRIIKTKTII